MKRNPYSVLLLDEIEKAHFDIFNILLQVFEDGQLTDSHGNTVDFKHAIIIMTSNIGARYLVDRTQMGFSTGGEPDQAKVEDLILNEVKKLFNPEFLNRLDEVILFETTCSTCSFFTWGVKLLPTFQRSHGRVSFQSIYHGSTAPRQGHRCSG